MDGANGQGFEVGAVEVPELGELPELVLLLAREIRRRPQWDELDREHVRRRAAELIASPAHCLVGARGPAGLMGYAWAHDLGPGLMATWSVAQLNELVVKMEARRQGVGRRLFEAVRAWAVSRESVKYLEWQGSHVATPFYERLGLEGAYLADPSEPPHYEVQVR